MKIDAEALVHPQERIDDLERNGLRMIQDPRAFRFGMDAVLLADFTAVKPRETVVDLGTGTGILPVLLSQKQETACFHAFEIQADMADMAARTMRLNGLEERIFVHAADMREAPALMGNGKADAVVCNPPYGKQGNTLLNAELPYALARHEASITIREMAGVAAALLRNRGRLSTVFPAPRMLELCDALRGVRLEPKRIRMICAKADRAPYLCLVEAMKNVKPALHWLPPLVVYYADGVESEEIRRIYHRSDAD